MFMSRGHQKMQNAILQIDNAQVEMRNKLLNYRTNYTEIDSKYNTVKSERKAAKKQIKYAERKIKNLERAKTKIRKNFERQMNIQLVICYQKAAKQEFGSFFDKNITKIITRA